jgi:hypothetical protein
VATSRGIVAAGSRGKVKQAEAMKRAGSVFAMRASSSWVTFCAIAGLVLGCSLIVAHAVAQGGGTQGGDVKGAE